MTSNAWIERLALLALLTLITAGCVERVVNDPWDRYRQWSWYTPPAEERKDKPKEVNWPAQEALRGWAILLNTFEGDKAERKAQQFLAQLSNQQKLPDVWLRPSGAEVQVFRGTFDDPDSPPAKRLLEETRKLEIDGVHAFAGVDYVSLRPRTPIRSDQPMNLGQYIGQHKWSLQVAAFDETMKDRRAAAEDYARQLREQGQPAYFYHGPYHSMVTLGLFAHEEAFISELGMPDRYAPPVRDLQKQFPNNLVNGKPAPNVVNGKEVGMQSSLLVEVR